MPPLLMGTGRWRWTQQHPSTTHLDGFRREEEEKQAQHPTTTHRSTQHTPGMKCHMPRRPSAASHAAQLVCCATRHTACLHFHTPHTWPGVPNAAQPVCGAAQRTACLPCQAPRSWFGLPHTTRSLSVLSHDTQPAHPAVQHTTGLACHARHSLPGVPHAKHIKHTPIGWPQPWGGPRKPY